MSQVANKPYLLHLDQNFWDGLVSYSKFRKESLGKEALGAKDWDDVNKAKGAEAEIAALLRLRNDYETFCQQRAASLPPK